MTSLPPENDTRKIKKRTQSYLKYSGMASQLLVLIFLAIWIGGKLDEYFNTEKKWFTVGMVLFFFVGWFLRLYRDVTKGS